VVEFLAKARRLEKEIKDTNRKERSQIILVADDGFCTKKTLKTLQSSKIKNQYTKLSSFSLYHLGNSLTKKSGKQFYSQ
jgi:hypothetical protein